MKFLIHSIGVCLLLSGIAPADSAESAASVEQKLVPTVLPPVLLSTDAFSYPMEGYLQGSPTGGFAKLLVHLNAQGSVVDGICLEATNHIFAEAATRGLFASDFQPAKESGNPISVRTELIIYFEITGVRMINAMDDVALRQHSMDGKKVAFALTPPPELDKPIKIVERGPVYGLKDEEGQKISGKVWIQVFIDANGKVRMPEVTRSSNSVLNAHALQTIKEWRFEGPLKNGDPTITRVVIPMGF